MSKRQVINHRECSIVEQERLMERRERLSSISLVIIVLTMVVTMVVIIVVIIVVTMVVKIVMIIVVTMVVIIVLIIVVTIVVILCISYINASDSWRLGKREMKRATGKKIKLGDNLKISHSLFYLDLRNFPAFTSIRLF